MHSNSPIPQFPDSPNLPKPLARALLDLGADAGTYDEHQKTPLYHAVRYNMGELVDLLIEKGADLTATINIDKWSPFHLACSMGHSAIVKQMLLEQQAAFVNEASVAGHTALHLAANNGHHVVVEALLEAGRYTRRCKEGWCNTKFCWAGV